MKKISYMNVIDALLYFKVEIDWVPITGKVRLHTDNWSIVIDRLMDRLNTEDSSISKEEVAIVINAREEEYTAFTLKINSSLHMAIEE